MQHQLKRQSQRMVWNWPLPATILDISYSQIFFWVSIEQKRGQVNQCRFCLPSHYLFLNFQYWLFLNFILCLFAVVHRDDLTMNVKRDVRQLPLDSPCREQIGPVEVSSDEWCNIPIMEIDKPSVFCLSRKDTADWSSDAVRLWVWWWFHVHLGRFSEAGFGGSWWTHTSR